MKKPRKAPQCGDQSSSSMQQLSPGVASLIHAPVIPEGVNLILYYNHVHFSFLWLVCNVFLNPESLGVHIH